MPYCAKAKCLRGHIIDPYVKIKFEDVISAGGKLRASRKRVSCGGEEDELNDQDFKVLDDLEKHGITISD